MKQANATHTQKFITDSRRQPGAIIAYDKEGRVVDYWPTSAEEHAQELYADLPSLPQVKTSARQLDALRKQRS